jgi:hypothetical protein
MKKTVSTKLSTAELARVAAARGSATVAEFVRQAVMEKVGAEKKESSEIALAIAAIAAGVERIEAGMARQSDTHATRELMTAFVLTTTKNAELIRQNHPGLLPE